MSPPRILVCAVGNSGSKYARTRHNAGVIVFEGLIERANKLSSTPLRLEEDADLNGWRTQDITVRLGDTPIDLSFYRPKGEMNRLRVAPPLRLQRPLVVVHDELHSDFGVVKRRLGGSDGGHKGLQSIARSLNNVSTWKLRIGIGRTREYGKPAPGEISSYVLGNFPPDQLERLSHDVADAAWASLAAIARDVRDGTRTRISTAPQEDGPLFEAYRIGRR